MTLPETPPVQHYAKGVRGSLPHPKKTALELDRIRVELEVWRLRTEPEPSRRDQVVWLRATHDLTYDQCGQVLGVSENRIARILRPQVDRRTGKVRSAGTVTVRCVACVWRGSRVIDSHEPCPRCGASDELVLPAAEVQWLKIPVPVAALAALGPDPAATVAASTAKMVTRVWLDEGSGGKRRRRRPAT